MTTKSITVYSFDELSKEEQQKAIRHNWAINCQHDWWDDVYDDAANIGLKITGFDLGRSQEITGKLTDDAESICKAILKNHGEQCETVAVAKEFIARIVAQKLADKEDEEIEYDLKESLLKCYFSLLKDEYEYLTSDEAVTETLLQYEFTEDGNIF